MIVTIATVEALIFRNHSWERLIVNIAIVLVFVAFYLRFLKPPSSRYRGAHRDSIVTNLVKLVNVMPRLNVTGDPGLNRLIDEIRASLLVDPAELRNRRVFARRRQYKPQQ